MREEALTVDDSMPAELAVAVDPVTHEHRKIFVQPSHASFRAKDYPSIIRALRQVESACCDEPSSVREGLRDILRMQLQDAIGQIPAGLQKCSEQLRHEQNLSSRSCVKIDMEACVLLDGGSTRGCKRVNIQFRKRGQDNEYP